MIKMYRNKIILFILVLLITLIPNLVSADEEMAISEVADWNSFVEAYNDENVSEIVLENDIQKENGGTDLVERTTSVKITGRTDKDKNYKLDVGKDLSLPMGKVSEKSVFTLENLVIASARDYRVESNTEYPVKKVEYIDENGFIGMIDDANWTFYFRNISSEPSFEAEIKENKKLQEMNLLVSARESLIVFDGSIDLTTRRMTAVVKNCLVKEGTKLEIKILGDKSVDHNEYTAYFENNRGVALGTICYPNKNSGGYFKVEDNVTMYFKGSRGNRVGSPIGGYWTDFTTGKNVNYYLSGIDNFLHALSSDESFRPNIYGNVEFGDNNVILGPDNSSHFSLYANGSVVIGKDSYIDTGSIAMGWGDDKGSANLIIKEGTTLNLTLIHDPLLYVLDKDSKITIETPKKLDLKRTSEPMSVWEHVFYIRDSGKIEIKNTDAKIWDSKNINGNPNNVFAKVPEIILRGEKDRDDPYKFHIYTTCKANRNIEKILNRDSCQRFLGENKFLTTATIVGGTGTLQSSIEKTLKNYNPSRISGSNRYKTSVEVSKKSYTSSDTVIIASGEQYTDKLTSTVLSNTLDAPILLSGQNKLPEEIKLEIERLKAKKIIIIGGTGTISQEVEDSLSNYEVERIGGKNRYETALFVAERVRGESNGNQTKAILVDGTNFPDAISMTTLANVDNTPILLTKPDSLEEKTKEAIKNWNIKFVTIGGGTSSVSEKTEKELQKDINVSRLAGTDRYDTSKKVAEYIYPNPKHIVVASGEVYPDAIVGSVYAAKNEAPIVLSKSANITSQVLDYINK